MQKLIITLLAGLLSLSVYAQKYGFVDTEYILSNIPTYKAAQDEIEELAKQWQVEIENGMAEVEKMYQKYQAEKVLLTSEMKTERESAIVKKEQEIKSLKNDYFGPEGLLYKKRKEKITPIQDQVYKAIKELANENGFAVVFDAASGPTILYYNPRYDISDDILTRLGYKN